MQTFLPEIGISNCASALDNKRLNKQVLEGYQIIKLLSDYHDKKAWAHHPAVLMWKGHEYSLRTYIQDMITEAKLRGIKMDKHIQNMNDIERTNKNNWGESMPKWFGSEARNRVLWTHRANLYLKDPIFYAQYEEAVYHKDNRPCCEGCRYYWPSHGERDAFKR